MVFCRIAESKRGGQAARDRGLPFMLSRSVPYICEVRSINAYAICNAQLAIAGVVSQEPLPLFPESRHDDRGDQLEINARCRFEFRYIYDDEDKRT